MVGFLMRRLVLFAGLAVAAGFACGPKEVPVARHEVDYKTELGRFGEWIVLRPYGRVWHPNESVVGKGFAPYVTGGQWKHGPDGWEFESQWGWGEYVFHRGRWLLASDLGWVWVLDQERAASWVEWRWGSDFVGWTPVPPPTPNPRPMLPSDRPWSFVKTRTFTQADLVPHLLNQEGIVKALQLTQEAPAEKARRGPDLEFVRAAGAFTGDGGVPDLTPPPEAAPPEVAPAEEKPQEEAPPPPSKKSKGKKKKK
jgi:hypothetical protein